jgi:hypothetical protein
MVIPAGKAVDVEPAPLQSNKHIQLCMRAAMWHVCAYT